MSAYTLTAADLGALENFESLPITSKNGTTVIVKRYNGRFAIATEAEITETPKGRTFPLKRKAHSADGAIRAALKL